MKCGAPPAACLLFLALCILLCTATAQDDDPEHHINLLLRLHRQEVLCQTCEILFNTVLDRLCVEPQLDFEGDRLSRLISTSCDYVDEPGHPVSEFIKACDDFSQITRNDLADVLRLNCIEAASFHVSHAVVKHSLPPDYKHVVCHEGEESEGLCLYLQSYTCGQTKLKVCPYRPVLNERGDGEELERRSPSKLTKNRMRPQSYKQRASAFKSQAHRRRGLVHGTREEL